MGKNLVYAFDYMVGDKNCSTVSVYDDNTVVVEDHTTNIVDLPFGRWGDKATIEDVNDLLEWRCFPRTRGNCKQLLKSGGLDFYDPFQICLKTDGRMSDDVFWIRFHDKDKLIRRTKDE